MNQKNRVEKIRRKYGVNAFKRFGQLGGSPILKAYSEGRVTVHKKKPRH